MEANGQKKMSSHENRLDIHLKSLKDLVLKIYEAHGGISNARRAGNSTSVAIQESAKVILKATWDAHVVSKEIWAAISLIEFDSLTLESPNEENGCHVVEMIPTTSVSAASNRVAHNVERETQVVIKPIEIDASDPESNDEESDDCQFVDDQPSTSAVAAAQVAEQIKRKTKKPAKRSRTANEIKFQCAVCPYKTNISTDFKRHLMMHAEERPFECFDCKKRFTKKSNLKVHMRTHSIDPEFACRICGKNIVNKMSLKLHELKHAKTKFVKKTTEKKRLKCKSCEYRTNDSHMLKRHMMVHSGEKPFECTICKTAFRQKHHLTEHMRTHTGEKPFRCRVCECTFAQQSTRDRHMASKHLTI